MPNIDKFTIEQSEIIVSGNTALIEIDGKYVPGIIGQVINDLVSINVSGLREEVPHSKIFNIYYHGMYRVVFAGSKKDHQEIVDLLELSKETNQTKLALNAYSNIARLRNLSNVSESKGAARFLRPVKLDYKTVGFLMQRAVNASQGSAEKATELFLSDLKERNLSIVNI